MKRIEDHEEKLISSMMKHLETSSASKDFTQDVMERIQLETIPARVSIDPLISKRAWILIGILFSLMIVVLYSATRVPVDVARTGFLDSINLPDIRLPDFSIIEWIKASEATLTWYTIGLASIFILTVLDRLLRHAKIPQGLVL
jgi:hypothetical protein